MVTDKATGESVIPFSCIPLLLCSSRCTGSLSPRAVVCTPSYTLSRTSSAMEMKIVSNKFFNASNLEVRLSHLQLINGFIQTTKALVASSPTNK